METLSWPPESRWRRRRRWQRWWQRRWQPRAARVALVSVLVGAAAGYLAGRASSDGPAPQPRPGRAAGEAGGAGAPLHFVAAHWEGRNDPAAKTFTLRANVTNGGPGAAQVLSVGASEPGLALTRVNYLMSTGVWQYGPAPPFVLQVGDTVGVVLAYRITDCATARRLGVRLPVRVRTGDGVRTLHVGSPEPYLDQWQPDVGALVRCG